MEEFKNINLEKLVEEASVDILDERRKSAANAVKIQLQRIEQLAIDVKNLKKDLNKKEEKLKAAQGKIDKVKGGDWKVLSDLIEQKKKGEK